MAEQNGKREKADDQQSAVSDQIREKGTIVFKSETTSEEMTVEVEYYESGKLIVDTEFDPLMGDDNYKGLIFSIAGHMLRTLQGMEEK